MTSIDPLSVRKSEVSKNPKSKDQLLHDELFEKIKREYVPSLFDKNDKHIKKTKNSKTSTEFNSQKSSSSLQEQRLSLLKDKQILNNKKLQHLDLPKEEREKILMEMANNDAEIKEIERSLKQNNGLK